MKVKLICSPDKLSPQDIVGPTPPKMTEYRGMPSLLTSGRTYGVLCKKDGCYRLLNDEGKDLFYSQRFFEVVDRQYYVPRVRYGRNWYIEIDWLQGSFSSLSGSPVIFFYPTRADKAWAAYLTNHQSGVLMAYCDEAKVESMLREIERYGNVDLAHTFSIDAMHGKLPYSQWKQLRQ